MKTALITTTIYVPKVLELYREYDKDVKFFITGDRKSPHEEIKDFISTLGNAIYYSDKDQEDLNYQCSEIIGWNKIMRRNIALLEAIRDGADLIITIDDDNIPLNPEYFSSFKKIFTSNYSGPMITNSSNWFNIGEFFNPHIYHRGFSYNHRKVKGDTQILPVCSKKVGVAAGLWYGDPDVDAMERITNFPQINSISDLLKSGIIVDNKCFTPFDSQNTGYIRELAPLMMVWCGVGRYDDIWASYVAQRIMAETDYHVHFGQPFVWQERNSQNLWSNLKDEIFGMENTPKFCEDLLNVQFSKGTIIDKLNELYEEMLTFDYLPPIVHNLGKAWCQDLEAIY